ncbi:histidine kinase, partial [Microbacterium sp. SUBG005]
RAMRQAQDDESRQRTALAVETTEQSLERIQAQSLRMTTLVEDLLLLARLDEGQELVYGSVDLTQIAVEAVGDAARRPRTTRGASRSPTSPSSSPATPRACTRSIANLLANASHAHARRSTVTVSVAHEGDEAVLRVHDDGPGIDP